MAYWETAKSQIGNSKEKDFIADTVSDVSSLPTSEDEVAPGASCLVIETSDVYMLDSTGTWRVL